MKLVNLHSPSKLINQGAVTAGTSSSSPCSPMRSQWKGRHRETVKGESVRDQRGQNHLTGTQGDQLRLLGSPKKSEVWDSSACLPRIFYVNITTYGQRVANRHVKFPVKYEVFALYISLCQGGVFGDTIASPSTFPSESVSGSMDVFSFRRQLSRLRSLRACLVFGGPIPNFVV